MGRKVSNKSRDTVPIQHASPFLFPLPPPKPTFSLLTPQQTLYRLPYTIILRNHQQILTNFSIVVLSPTT
jgi:hypothetical protein